jgi:hypothetical protein
MPQSKGQRSSLTMEAALLAGSVALACLVGTVAGTT